ncbi:hypothetical protein [Nitrobacter sp.]|uniref:hypothetical protein n=1 Tax=Nitrobacter sp. TaxID=29420 RepID=UPI0029CAAD92|nr:hypothetical protein [Nitrobacter sp.]
MRRSQRLIASAVLISLCGVLAGCGGGGMSNWDPSDMLDFLDTKKKLPGKREPVFPDGVPGIEQGVPKDLYKSNVEQQQQEQSTAAVTASPPAGTTGHARRSGAAAGSAGAPAPAGGADGAAAAEPPRKPKRLVHRRTTSLPKDEPAPQQEAAPQQSPDASPFPAPMPSGSFQR